MNFIPKVIATSKSLATLFEYEIQEHNKLIAAARILKLTDSEISYKLEIDIFNRKHYDSYHNILRQCLYKFINMLGANLKRDARITVITETGKIHSVGVIKALHIEF